jgi:hypothetical protein
MRPARITDPFDHADWRFELKPDGCRARTQDLRRGILTEGKQRWMT